MTIQGDDAEKLADAVANLTNEVEGHPVVTSSAVRTSLPLLAAMIPLIGITAGIWFNFRSESSARKDEKISRAREEEIRVLELAVPVYRNLAVQDARLDFELIRCEDAVFKWLDTDEGSDEEKAAQREIDDCAEKVKLAHSEVSAAISEAKLVSTENLIIPVDYFTGAWSDLQYRQDELIEYKGLECTPVEGEPVEGDIDFCFTLYSDAVAEFALIRFCVFEKVRQNVVLEERPVVDPDCEPFYAPQESE